VRFSKPRLAHGKKLTVRGFFPMQKSEKRQANGAEKKITVASTTPVGALKLKPAAQYLSLSKPSVYRLVARGLLRPNRALRHLLFSKAELDRFLSEYTTEGS
jgi:excisionase family DNA binding protein